MLAFVLMLVALICFVLAAFPLGSSQPKINLLALGLVFMAASFCAQLYPG